MNSEDLHYVYWNGTERNDELVHSIPGAGSVGVSSPNLTLNSNDEPFISYHSNMFNTDPAVGVAVRNGANDWTTPAWLLEGTTPGGQTSITADTNEVLHVSYHDDTAGELGYAQVMEDSDDDGLPDWWGIKYFGNLGQGPKDDPDGDGLTDEDEMFLGPDPFDSGTDGDGQNDYEEVVITGMSPTNVASFLKIDGLYPLAFGIELRWLSATGRVYDLLSSTNLMEGFQPLQSDLPAGTGGFTVVTNVPGHSPIFYKVRIRLP